MRSCARQSGERENARDRPEAPLDQVHGVDALVHDRAAAVELPGAAPRAAVVIRLRAPPLVVGVADGDPPEPPLGDGGLQRDGALGEPVGEDRADLDAVFVASADDRVGAVERDLDGLLDDHVLSAARGGHGRLQVRAARRADADDVHVLAAHQVIVIRDRVAAVLLRKLLAVILRDVRAGDQPRVRQVRNGGGVVLADHPASDDGETVGFHVIFSPARSPGRTCASPP